MKTGEQALLEKIDKLIIENLDLKKKVTSAAQTIPTPSQTLVQSPEASSVSFSPKPLTPPASSEQISPKKTILSGLQTREQLILKTIKDLGLDSDKDLGIIENSLVVIPSGADDATMKELVQMIREYIDNKNVFRFGVLPKPGIFVSDTKGELALLHAISEHDYTVDSRETGIKPRYLFAKNFLMYYHIASSATERDTKYMNRSDQVANMIASMINFKSLLEYREAGKMVQPDENMPSEKLSQGVLGKR